MITIYTRKGEEILIDEEDYEMITQYTWDLSSNGYARARPQISGIRPQFLMHRILLGAKDDELVDHIDGNKLNNTRDNIRIATHEENARNRKTPVINRSGYKGVAKVKGYNRFKSYIQVSGSQMHLGYFDNPHDAARMYNFWAVDLFGEFARLNIINEEAS